MRTYLGEELVLEVAEGRALGSGEGGGRGHLRNTHLLDGGSGGYLLHGESGSLHDGGVDGGDGGGGDFGRHL